jgi:hypothetical protein
MQKARVFEHVRSILIGFVTMGPLDSAVGVARSQASDSLGARRRGEARAEESTDIHIDGASACAFDTPLGLEPVDCPWGDRRSHL